MSIVGERVIADVQVAKAARYLAQLAVTDGGYTVRGVSGWAHAHDVGCATGMRMDGQLPQLHRTGLADRVELGPGGSAGEYWLYRITDAGARVSAATWDDAYERVVGPGERERPAPVYLARGPRRALEVLRLAYEAGGERFGEHGWKTGRELTLFVEELNREQERVNEQSYSRLDSMDFNWLVSVGLAEKREFEHGGRKVPAVFWRVSSTGRDAAVLSWRAPRELEAGING